MFNQSTCPERFRGCLLPCAVCSHWPTTRYRDISCRQLNVFLSCHPKVHLCCTVPGILLTLNLFYCRNSSAGTVGMRHLCCCRRGVTIAAICPGLSHGCGPADVLMLQVAMQQSDYIAYNIWADKERRRPLDFRCGLSSRVPPPPRSYDYGHP